MDRRARVSLPQIFKIDDSWKKEILPNEEAIVPASEQPDSGNDGENGLESARQNEDRLTDLGLQEIVQSLPRDPRNQGSFRYL